MVCIFASVPGAEQICNFLRKTFGEKMADEKKKTYIKAKRKLTAQERKLNIYRVVTILLVVVLIIVVILWARNYFINSNAQEQYTHMQQEVNTVDVYQENETEQETETDAGEQEDIFQALEIEIPEKNLDWESLRQINKDIYAWLYIPDTNVDYPILQHPSDDTYYLNHNLDGSKGYPGCIFTQTLNSRDFDDFNTVIYGHNMKNESMFRTLHEFEDESFFMGHPYMYIYTEDEVLVYEVFAAYVSDNAHILNTNDFSSEEGFEAYLQKAYDQAKSNGWYRDGVSASNRIVTLSTCTSGINSSSQRFLVQAVLLRGDFWQSEEPDVEQDVPEIYDPFTGFDGEDAAESNQELHKTMGDDLEKLDGKVPLDATGKQ